MSMRRKDGIPNSRDTEMRGMKKGNERIGERVSDGLGILKEWRTLGLFKRV